MCVCLSLWNHLFLMYHVAERDPVRTKRVLVNMRFVGYRPEGDAVRGWHSDWHCGPTPLVSWVRVSALALFGVCMFFCVFAGIPPDSLVSPAVQRHATLN